MSETVPTPPNPYPLPPFVPQQPKNTNTALWITLAIVGGVVVLCLGCMGFGLIGSALDTGSSDGGKKAAVETSDDPTEPRETYATPDPGDFRLTVKILEKQCFGSAGCNVTYRIELSYGGPALDPSVTYELTYEVYGVEDGPQINTLDVTGDEYSTDNEENAQTTSASKKLTAKITDITGA